MIPTGDLFCHIKNEPYFSQDLEMELVTAVGSCQLFIQCWVFLMPLLQGSQPARRSFSLLRQMLEPASVPSLCFHLQEGLPPRCQAGSLQLPSGSESEPRSCVLG